ncbi:divergent AAA domain protein (macronuclear) [Tetrahymena thermophila SB210]|uniref:Divergent AAA domain protein n=1 Tax=Tetrahymena thermophila (strain SB210) TaxID=312017 RepID=I7LVP2_TETTS|nr:divergent AAA domain protein [Tetrahymena thermophila SB210]EAR99451.2 divergent AAA domain protein [Tetrahymena thermophila SB210]|eukprot:XP_001019696.2 divergent AAA domain protein [Tetrahymena thermophila SB210]
MDTLNESTEQTIDFRPSKYINERKGSYIYGTKITLPESHKLEFKDYGLPFTPNLNFTLLKTMCGFLNRSGGTILIGVNDDKIIKGIKINNMDQLKLHFDELKKRFFPEPLGFIKTVEIPVKKYIGEDQEKYTWLPNTYVVRIEVSQGYLDKLYTFKFPNNEKQETVYSAFREDASLRTLDTFEKIYEKIYQKALCPESKSKAIIYEEPDQQGLEECQNFQKPEEHKIKHNSLAFTNILRDRIKDFKKYLEDYLKSLGFNQLNKRCNKQDKQIL